MRHVHFLLILMLLGVTAFSQNQLRIGGEIGYSIGGKQEDSGIMYVNEEQVWSEWPFHGPRAGLNGRLFFGKCWNFQFGLQGQYLYKFVDASVMSLGTVSQQRTDIAIRVKAWTLSAPVAAGIVLREARLAHILQIGLTPSFFLSGGYRRDFRLTSSSLSQTVTSSETIDVDSVRLMNRINLHATAAYQVEFPFPVYLGIEYSLGFQNNVYGMSNTMYLPTSLLSVTVGYRPIRLSRVRRMPETLFN